jgi:hypothetical protein
VTDTTMAKRSQNLLRAPSSAVRAVLTRSSTSDSRAASFTPLTCRIILVMRRTRLSQSAVISSSRGPIFRESSGVEIITRKMMGSAEMKGPNPNCVYRM